MFAIALEQAHLLWIPVATPLGVDDIEALTVICPDNKVVFLVINRENLSFLRDLPGLFQPCVYVFYLMNGGWPQPERLLAQPVTPPMYSGAPVAGVRRARGPCLTIPRVRVDIG